SGDMEMGEVEGGSASENAVIIVGEPLRLHQGILAPGGAAGEIGALRSMAIERARDLLAPLRHQMDRAVAKILDPLGMPEQAGRRRRRVAEVDGERVAHVACGTAEQRIAP